jgi:hypothetical protein
MMDPNENVWNDDGEYRYDGQHSNGWVPKPGEAGPSDWLTRSRSGSLASSKASSVDLRHPQILFQVDNVEQGTRNEHVPNNGLLGDDDQSEFQKRLRSIFDGSEQVGEDKPSGRSNVTRPSNHRLERHDDANDLADRPDSGSSTPRSGRDVEWTSNGDASETSAKYPPHEMPPSNSMTRSEVSCCCSLVY